MTDIIKKLNDLIGKPYHEINYHCYSFIEEVLNVPKLDDVHVATAKDDVNKYIGLFREKTFPTDFCIVLLGKSHIGVFFNGYIYHNDVKGVRAETVRAMKYRYNNFKFYEVR